MADLRGRAASKRCIQKTNYRRTQARDACDKRRNVTTGNILFENEYS
jgi:hypothetical protein